MVQPPAPQPPQNLAELRQALQTARDDLLTALELLRDHQFETDATAREQARRLAEAWLRQARTD